MPKLEKAIKAFSEIAGSFRRRVFDVYEELYAIFPENREGLLTTSLFSLQIELKDGMVELQKADYCRGCYMGIIEDDFPVEWLWTDGWKEKEKEARQVFLEKRVEEHAAKAERKKRLELKQLAELKRKYEQEPK